MEHQKLAEIGVLGVLNENGPQNVNSVQDVLQKAFSDYWGYGTGVLTPVTRRLEENGCIQSVHDEQKSQYKYAITPRGVEKLSDLLREPYSDDDLTDISRRHDFVIKLGFLHHLPEREQVGILQELEEKIKREREEWRQHKQQYSSEDSFGHDGYRQDFLDLKIDILDVHLEWAQNLDLKSISDR